MQLGTEFQCEIEKCAMGGDGLTRVDGEVIFLKGTLPGEKVIGRVTAAKSNFSRAEVVRFGSRNSHRVEPACPYFGRCPGCSYQHCTPEYETELKLGQFRDLLAGLPAAVAAPDASAVLEEIPAFLPQPVLGYRNKIVLHAHKVRGETFFGYVTADNVTVVDIEACPLAHPAINAVLAQLRADRGFFHSLHEGMHVTFRHTEADGVQYWRNAPGRNLSWLRESAPFGPMSVPCGSFYQVNPAGNARLIELYTNVLQCEEPQRVIDLYAGAGLFACAAAAAGVREVTAVETDAAATEAARFNLQKYLGAAYDDGNVLTGDAGKLFAREFPAVAPGTLLTVDPPRNGLSFPAVQAINASGVESLVYISCGPATWVRDAQRLSKGGFALQQLELVNLFPRTEHFEIFSFWKRM